MVVAIADTHAVIWYLFDDARLSILAKETFHSAVMQGQFIGVSAISLIEIVYLEERDRVPSGTGERLLMALNDTNSVLQECPVDIGVALALLQVDRAEIPDMPDRIIAATALHLNVPVISRDSKIRDSQIQTIW